MNRKGEEGIESPLVAALTEALPAIILVVFFLSLFFVLVSVFSGGNQKDHGAIVSLQLLGKQAQSLGVQVDPGIFSGMFSWLKRIFGKEPDFVGDGGGFGGAGAASGWDSPAAASPSDARVMWPAQERILTSCYGARTVNGQADPLHDGIDIAGDPSEDVVAFAGGTVAQVCAQPCGGFGNSVLIDHGKGIFTRYSHMDHFAPNVKEGMRVGKGDVLGSVGHTGNVEAGANHLDFKVFTGSDIGKDRGKNPLCFFPDSELRTLTIGPGADSCRRYVKADGTLDLTRANPTVAQECAGIAPLTPDVVAQPLPEPAGGVRVASTIVNIPEGYVLVGFDKGEDSLKFGEGSLLKTSSIAIARPRECGAQSCLCVLRPSKSGSADATLQFSLVECAKISAGHVAGTIDYTQYLQEGKVVENTWFGIGTATLRFEKKQQSTSGGRPLYPLLLTFSLGPRLILLRYYPEYGGADDGGLLVLDPACYTSEYKQDGTCAIGYSSPKHPLDEAPLQISCESASLHSSLAPACSGAFVSQADCDAARSTSALARSVCPPLFSKASAALEGESVERTATTPFAGSDHCVRCLAERDPDHASMTRCSIEEQPASACAAK